MDNNELLVQIRGIIKEEVRSIVKEEVRSIVKEEVNEVREEVKKINEKLYQTEQRLTEKMNDMDKRLTDNINDVEVRLNKKIDDVQQDVKDIKIKLDVVYEKVAQHEEYNNKANTRYDKLNKDVGDLKLFVREDETDSNGK